MPGGQWYNYQTGQYEAGEQDPNSIETPADLAQQAQQFVEQSRNNKWEGRRDFTARASPVYNPSTRSWVLETASDLPYNANVPEAFRKAPDSWLAGLQFTDTDPRLAGKKIRDPSQVWYDPKYGWIMHQDNWYQKKHWQDKVAKWAPTAIMALGTMGMSWPATMAFNAGTTAMRGMAEGQKFGKVLKNVGINAAASAAAKYGADFLTQGMDSGLGKWAARKAIGQGVGLAKRKLMYPGRG